MWFTIIVGILGGISALISILHNLHSSTNTLLPRQAERRKKQGDNLIAQMRVLENELVGKCGCTSGGQADPTCMSRTVDD